MNRKSTLEELERQNRHLRLRLEAAETQVARLQTFERKYTQLFDHAGAGICEVDFRTGRFQWVNEVLIHYTGYSREELLRMPVVDLLSEGSRVRFLERVQRLLAGQAVPENVEYEAVARDGRRFWIQLHVRHTFQDGIPTGAHVVMHDITRRIQAEAALRESEARYRNLVEQAQDGIVIVHRGKLAYVNPCFARFTGYSVEALLGKSAEVIISGDLVHKLLVIFKRRMDGNEEPYISESRLLRSDGRELHVEVSIGQIPFDGSSASLVLVRDITERKKSEEALARSEGFSRTILENIAERVFAKDCSGRYTFFNEACCRFWGISREAAIGKTDCELHSPDIAHRCLASDRFVFENDRTYYGEERGRDPAGGDLVLAVVKAPLKDAAGKTVGLVGISRDITRQKQNELERIETERRLRFLSSCLLRAQEAERNRLSKELHDELGQALAILKHMLRTVVRETEPGKHPSPTADEALGVVDGIIDKLRRISKDLSPTILEDLGLTASLKSMVDTFSKMHGIPVSSRIVDIDGLFAAETRINVYRIFQESLNNIAKHAAARRVSIEICKSGHQTVLTIADDGRGFERQRIRRQDGGGMGLTILAERARMIGASLEIESTEGKGTRIRLEVPHTPGWRLKAAGGRMRKRAAAGSRVNARE